MEIVDGFVVVSVATAIRLIREVMDKSTAELSSEHDMQPMYDGVHFHFRGTPGGFNRYRRGGIPWIAVRQVEPGPLVGAVWDGTMFGDTDFEGVSG